MEIDFTKFQTAVKSMGCYYYYSKRVESENTIGIYVAKKNKVN